MQAKKYPRPSARSRALIRRNILSTLETREDTDAMWLNDVHSGSPVAATQTQEHTVCYEDLPTIPLFVLSPSVAIHEELLDDDKTVQFNKPKIEHDANPLTALLCDETISLITALGPRRIYVERHGEIQQTALHFSDEQHMLRVIEQFLSTAKQSLPLHGSLADVCLPDGSLLTIALPPNAVNGPALTIRKHSKNLSTLSGLVKQGSMSQEMADMLHGCVQARLNILICGPVGSGRTTLLNALCAAIPPQERIVTIEDSAELRLKQSHTVVLQTNRRNSTTTSDLIAYAERMHGNRVIVGECRSSEAETLLQAMYNGLNGVMTTIYAQNVQDCLTRFETLCALASKEQSSSRKKLLRSQIAQSINIVVLLSIEHKVTNVIEVQPADEDSWKIQSLFYYQDNDTKKEAKDAFKASGFQSALLEQRK